MHGLSLGIIFVNTQPMLHDDYNGVEIAGAIIAGACASIGSNRLVVCAISVCTRMDCLMSLSFQAVCGGACTPTVAVARDSLRRDRFGGQALHEAPVLSHLLSLQLIKTRKSFSNPVLVFPLAGSESHTYVRDVSIVCIFVCVALQPLASTSLSSATCKSSGSVQTKPTTALLAPQACGPSAGTPTTLVSLLFNKPQRDLSYSHSLLLLSAMFSHLLAGLSAGLHVELAYGLPLFIFPSRTRPLRSTRA